MISHCIQLFSHSKPHGWPWNTLSAATVQPAKSPSPHSHSQAGLLPATSDGGNRVEPGRGDDWPVSMSWGVFEKKKTLQKPQKKQLQHQNQRDDYLLDDLQWQFPIFWIDVCLFPAKNQRNCGGTSGKCGHEDPPTAVCVRTIWPSNLEIENKKSERPTHVSTSPEFPATSSTRMPHPNCYQQAMTRLLLAYPNYGWSTTLW